MTLAHKLICKIATLSRTHKLRRLDPLFRLIHNPDNRKENAVKRAIVLDNKLVFNIDTSSYLEWTMFFYGDYEPFIQKIIMSVLRPGDIVIDVGANIGIHSLVMAQTVGKTGAVYSFEPHPIIFNKLVTNIGLNNMRWVHPIKAALSDSSGQAVLQGFGESSNQGTSTLCTSDKTNNQFQIKTITLDEFVASTKIPSLSLIKIDVEGHELNVLQGAIKTLATFKPLIIFENSKKNIPCELFWNLGYAIYQIHHDHVTPSIMANTKGYNFLAIPLDYKESIAHR